MLSEYCLLERQALHEYICNCYHCTHAAQSRWEWFQKNQKLLEWNKGPVSRENQSSSGQIVRNQLCNCKWTGSWHCKLIFKNKRISEHTTLNFF